MSLREELRTRASVLEYADYRQTTIMLAKLLLWMREQPEIKPVLKDLNTTGPVYQRLNLGPHPQVRRDAASAVETEKDMAAIGLAMMELCTIPGGRDEFYQIAYTFGVGVPPNTPSPPDYLRDTAMKRYVHPLLNYVMRNLPEAAQTSVAAGNGLAGSIPSEMPTGKNPQIVFVVHGRNEVARKTMFDFLRAIGLKPLEWSEAVKATGEASPYIGQILDKAFSIAQAIVVLMTPDDEAWLRKEFHLSHDAPYEKEPTGQARPNVLFEAGMAMGRNPTQTVLVELGTLRPFSDVGGRHVLRMNNSIERRQELADRLKTAGCPVNLTGAEWHTVGSFEYKQFDATGRKHQQRSPGRAMKLTFTLNQGEALRRGIDCPGSSASIEVIPAELTQHQREIIANHMRPGSTDVFGLHIGRYGQVEQAERIAAIKPELGSLLEAIEENDEQVRAKLTQLAKESDDVAF
jgi:predicted nucleotide-binding protein